MFFSSDAEINLINVLNQPITVILSYFNLLSKTMERLSIETRCNFGRASKWNSCWCPV